MYLVDTNVLVETKNRYYAFDIAPGFWTWLDYAHENSLACSIDPVRDELIDGNDELAEWTRRHQDFFRAIDARTATFFAPLTMWANSCSYTPAAISELVGNTADYYLVAYARVHTHTVVTHERSQPNAQKRVPIRESCIAMGVAYTDTFAMLRNTKAKFSLAL